MANEKRLVCPLKLIGGNNSYAQDPFCEKELCAWWANYAKECCIATIACELADSTISQTVYGNEWAKMDGDGNG